MLRRLRGFISKSLDVVLVNPAPVHVYSGMVPGVIAGHYAPAEAEIDLARLAREAGAEFIEDAAQSLDLASRRVHLAGGDSVDYDYLSLNIGSLPNFAGVPGAQAHAIAAKPFVRLFQRWRELKAAGLGSARLAVAGGGAAGIELAMAMKFAGAAEVTVFSDKKALPQAGEARILAALERTDVALRSDCPVTAVEPGPLVVSAKGRERFDALFWTAGAAASPLIAESRLQADAAGFALVDENLRSVSQSGVFAAGDAASLRGATVPKSGVYAVREGAVLAENLTRVVRGQPLEAYEPQKKSLVLLSCGGRYAIAARGGWSAEGGWVWRWKDWIDRRWVKSFG